MQSVTIPLRSKLRPFQPLSGASDRGYREDLYYSQGLAAALPRSEPFEVAYRSRAAIGTAPTTGHCQNPIEWTAEKSLLLGKSTTNISPILPPFPVGFAVHERYRTCKVRNMAGTDDAFCDSL